MAPQQLKQMLIDHLGHPPTDSQLKALSALSLFLESRKPNCTLLINGYAGTGKTTLTKAVVATLPALNYGVVLLAPTGRSAKVLGFYTGLPAYTIHRKIYKPKSDPSGFLSMQLMPNPHKSTVFIVDEASMIPSGNGLFESRDLLDDLLLYVFSNKNNRLILLGDTAQLPPVHLLKSPALDIAYLQNLRPLTAARCTLTEVVRQEAESGILALATALRKHLAETPDEFFKIPQLARDVERIHGGEFADYVDSEYAAAGQEQTLVITRSNKSANLYNQQIRHRLLWREDRVNAGDVLMIVKNNYFWIPQESKAGFIANGDTAEVVTLMRTEEKYGLHFADARLHLIDYPDEPEFEAKILLDSIDAPQASLDLEKMQAMREMVEEQFSKLSKTKRRELMKKDPYLNALQVKFAYAVTCHKAQGGQWNSVFVDQGYLTEDQLDVGFWRWLYTAVTRATQKLYLVNFSDRFFGE